jgi:uncharacterized protein YdbL (DUF1318 family)
MKKIFIVLSAVVLLSCAKVNLQTSQPLKVDINMRVDVYQHVAKDVESIQDQIYGKSEKKINAISLFEEAFAQDQSELSAAVARRKDRKDKIWDYFSKGYIGENRDALLVVRDVSGSARTEVESAISEENRDRDIIYNATAQKNGAALDQVRKVFFDDDYNRAGSGFWFELNKGGAYTWVKK